jgi:integrase
VQVTIPGTFASRKLAERALARKQEELGRGIRVQPKAGKETLKSFSVRWMADRVLADRTRELYQGLLDRHILPTFGRYGIGEIPPGRVRSWNANLAKEHPTTAAKAYRLLRGMLETAVTDDLIARNPCRVAKAGIEQAPERPTANLAELAAIVEAMPDRLKVLPLLATWCQLRRSELLGLRRRDVDLLHGTITVSQTLQRVTGAGVSFKEPKSRAGWRTVAIPNHILPALVDHLATFVAEDVDSLILTGEKGGALNPQQLQVAWSKARTAAGRPDLHLHDLRHTGATWAAATGASTKEIMARLGHDSPRAALIYQHASESRDRVIADALSEMAESAPVVRLEDGRKKLRHTEGTSPGLSVADGQS